MDRFSADKLQELGYWSGLTNSGVVETTSELASDFSPPWVSLESAPGILYVCRFRRFRFALVGTHLAVVMIQLRLLAIV